MGESAATAMQPDYDSAISDMQIEIAGLLDEIKDLQAQLAAAKETIEFAWLNGMIDR